MNVTSIASVPGELQWRNDPLETASDGRDHLSITAGAACDWFIDPAGRYASNNAPLALFAPPDDVFRLEASVSVEFAAPFDAGGLFLYARDDWWAKLCFENSQDGAPMIVSVVTRGASDDCNSVEISDPTVGLRLYRNRDQLAFHYARENEQRWHMVRQFTLGKLDRPLVGFIAQSPRGTRCRTEFSRIKYKPQALSDLRSGE